MSAGKADVGSQEEHLESRQHTISDEVVYLNEASEIFGNTRTVASELYRNGAAFIELKIAFEGDRDGYCLAIVGACNSHFAGWRALDKKLVLAPVQGNAPMLVEVTNLVQPPQRVTLVGCPSVVWLKFVDDDDCSIRDSSQLVGEPNPGLRVGVSGDWKLDVPWDLDNSGERPNELVQRCPHIVDSIPRNQPDAVRDIREAASELISIISGVFVCGNSVGFRRIAKSTHLTLKRIQMILRPTQLSLSIIYPGHTES